MLLSLVQILTTIYLFFAMMFFAGISWNKRTDKNIFIGNFLSALLSGSALFLIWR